MLHNIIRGKLCLCFCHVLVVYKASFLNAERKLFPWEALFCLTPAIQNPTIYICMAFLKHWVRAVGTRYLKAFLITWSHSEHGSCERPECAKSTSRLSRPRPLPALDVYLKATVLAPFPFRHFAKQPRGRHSHCASSDARACVTLHCSIFFSLQVPGTKHPFNG